MRDGTLAVLTVACVLAWGCGGSGQPRETSAARAPEWFTEAAEASGLRFAHFNGMSGDLLMPEILGPGVALFDYDNDGDLDVFVPQGQMLGAGKTISQALFPPRMPPPLSGRLFRNDLEVHPDGTRSLHFTDVTAQSGITRPGTAWASRPAISTTTASSICT